VPEQEIGQVLQDGSLLPGEGRIFVRPAIPEWQESAQDYEDLIDDLANQGIEVELAEIKGIPSGGDLGADFVPEAFAIYVGLKVTDALIADVVAAVKRTVVVRAKTRWWRRGEQVKGVIYGPDGEVVREVTWTSAEGRPQEGSGVSKAQ